MALRKTLYDSFNMKLHESDKCPGSGRLISTIEKKWIVQSMIHEHEYNGFSDGHRKMYEDDIRHRMVEAGIDEFYGEARAILSELKPELMSVLPYCSRRIDELFDKLQKALNGEELL